jgi:hypothetical protein
MSLYESLSRVLAPFASRLNGLLTGYDGTTYSSPAEAVRTQISDLHVLIGDIQGDAKISGSAVGYDGTESGLSATTMQGAIDEVSGDVTAVNGRLQKLDSTLDYSERTIRMDNPTMWRNGWVRPDGTYGSTNQNLVNRTMYAGNGESCTITMAEGWVIQKISEYGTADDTTSYIQNIFYDTSGVTSITATLEAGKFYVFQIRKEPIADVDLHEVTDDTFVITYIKGSSEVIDTLTENVETLSGDVEDIKTALDEVVEPKFVPTVTFTDGKGINQSTGAVVNDTNFSYSDYVETQGLSRVLLTMPVITTSLSRGIAFYDESKTYISGVRCIINSEGGVIERNLPIPKNAAYFRTTWFSSSSDQYPLYEFKCVLNEGQLEGDELTAASANALDVSAITYGYLIDESNSQSFNDQFCVTDYIPVKQGEILVLSYAPYNVAQEMLRVTAFNKYRENVSSLGTRNVNSYTVPEGVGYVRVSTRSVNIKNTSYIHKDGTTGKYQPYARESVSSMAGGNYDNVSNLLRYPLSTLPSYIIKNLAYKPLGQLTKGYVCFVSDDGAADLTTYTIPMFISKGVPGTWAVMSDSQCFLTEESTAVVVDSVQNHGCEIAQHASSEWTGYDEFTLNRFFDAQETFFSNLGLTAYGAVCPAHQINDMVRCVAGGRFGCLRTGFGLGAPYYGYYMNGARSNLYGLSCFSLFDKTAAEISAIIDTAVSEHLLCIIFWHDQSLTEESKTKFEAVVDYAKTSGAELITMKDIPTII